MRTSTRINSRTRFTNDLLGKPSTFIRKIPINDGKTIIEKVETGFISFRLVDNEDADNIDTEPPTKEAKLSEINIDSKKVIKKISKSIKNSSVIRNKKNIVLINDRPNKEIVYRPSCECFGGAKLITLVINKDKLLENNELEKPKSKVLSKNKQNVSVLNKSIVHKGKELSKLKQKQLSKRRRKILSQNPNKGSKSSIELLEDELTENTKPMRKLKTERVLPVLEILQETQSSRFKSKQSAKQKQQVLLSSKHASQKENKKAKSKSKPLAISEERILLMNKNGNETRKSNLKITSRRKVNVVSNKRSTRKTKTS